MRRELALASCVALCVTFACSTEVTLHFFEPVVDNAGGASTAGASEAGVGAGGTDVGGTDSGGTDAAGAGPETCQDLGPEVCNHGDDDCNGMTDEGCTHTINWGPQPDGDSLGHAGEGVTFAEVCPTGTILSGIRVGFGEALNQVAALCSQVGVTAMTTKATTTFSLTVGAQTVRAFVPAVTQDASNQVADLSCPDGLFASRLEGDDDPTRRILDLRIRCAPLIVTEETSGAFFIYLDVSKEVTVPPLACASCSGAPAYAFSSAVPAGQIPRRLFGGVGALINRVGIGTNTARIARL